MKLIDFSNCKINNATNYGGSDRKFGIIYNNEPYMIKFAERVEKRNELATSNINNCISEYISSKIAASVGIPTHETLLGYYQDELVVACKDFCKPNQVSQEFAQYMRMKYDSHDIGKLPKLEQIYDIINTVPQLQPIKEAAIKRYWETFIIDALTANFDRHKGNWGYLADRQTGEITLAPTYDYGSTLYPALSDNGIKDILQNPKDVCERIFVFPTTALLVNNVKVTYFDMLTSGYDQNCSMAIRNIVPKINIDKIHTIIRGTPLITEERKLFYGTMLELRKQFLLDDAFERAINRHYNNNALRNIENGIPYTREVFARDWMRQKYDSCVPVIEDKTIGIIRPQPYINNSDSNNGHGGLGE